MNKILFGNGISLNFKYDEYNYDSILKKFLHGLKVAMEKDFRLEQHHNEDFIMGLINKYGKKENAYEGIFWKIYMDILIYLIKNDNPSLPRYYKKQKYDSPEELVEQVVEFITRDTAVNNFAIYTDQFFSNAYNFMEYALSRAIGINKEFNNTIKIPYNVEFINFIKSFDQAITTNYYTDIEEHKEIIYAHGSIKHRKNYNFRINVKNKKERLGIGSEFEDGTSKILFGGNYEEKIILNSLLVWNPYEGIRRIEPKFLMDLSAEDNMTIIGLSTRADESMIKNIFETCKKVIVYAYDDKEEWECFSSNYKNVVVKNAKTLPFIN